MACDEKTYTEVRLMKNSEIVRFLRDVHGHMYVPELTRLFDYAAYLPEQSSIIEFGHYQGLSTIALALGAKVQGNKVHTFDPHVPVENTDPMSDGTDALYSAADIPVFLDNIVKKGVQDTVIPIFMPSDAFQSYHNHKPVRLAFIDGSHIYTQVMRDALTLYQRLEVGGTLALHDSDWDGPKRVIIHLTLYEGMSTLERVNSTTFLRKEDA